jgi:uncharacterized membrane protein (UPF0136 family)
LFAALVIVIVVGYAGMAVIRTKREGTSPSKRSLVAVLVSGIALAIALWLLAAGNDSEVLSWPMLIFLLALLAFCVVLFWRSKKPYYLIMLILVAEMLLFLSSLHLGIQDAQSHLALDRSKFSIPPRTLAIVTVNTKAPLDHGTPPSTECPCLYRNLRLVAFQDNLYYLFDPQAQAKGNPPSTYVIPLDNILYLVVEPASVPMTTTLPVATSAVTNTQFVSPTMAVPAPIPLPSQSPIP